MATAIGRPTANGRRGITWWPGLIPCLATAVAVHQSPWVAMWLLASAFFLAFKLWTLMDYDASARVSFRTALLYLVAWPGMDAGAFFSPRGATTRTATSHWSLAVGNTLLGAALLWCVGKFGAEWHDLLGGWVGLIGLSLLMHFGICHVLALVWRRRGIAVEPIMHWPLCARSVSDFWSHRWNRAFRDLAQTLVFRPLHRRFGTAGSTMSVFALSGVLHDVCISWPARQGYGWPTLYFLIQGCAVLLEKSKAGRRLGLGRGLAGRLFGWAIVVPGAFWLYHPPFIREVVLPMMRAAHAM